MKKVIIKGLAFFVLGVVLIGCHDTPKEVLQNSGTGIFGQHSLLRTERLNSIGGSMSGSFFLGFGSVGGVIKSDTELRFYWSPKPGEIVPTTLPYSRFKFIIDETKSVPTVEFVFNKDWLNDGFGGQEYKVPENLNDIISEELELAKVRISKKSLEEEVFLPKVR